MKWKRDILHFFFLFFFLPQENFSSHTTKQQKGFGVSGGEKKNTENKKNKPKKKNNKTGTLVGPAQEAIPPILFLPLPSFFNNRTTRRFDASKKNLHLSFTSEQTQ